MVGRHAALVLIFVAGCSRASPMPAAEDAAVSPDATPDSGYAEADTASALDASPGCAHAPVEKDCADGFCRIPAGCFMMGSPLGEFQRAVQNEEQIQVTLTHSFLIGEHELTRKEWVSAGLTLPNGATDAGVEDGIACTDDDCPVTHVSWYDALAFANRLSEQHTPPLPKCYELTGCTGAIGVDLSCASATPADGSIYTCKGYRLPTEAEWEYAARAGTREAFFSGPIKVIDPPTACRPDPNLEAIGWYCFNSGKKTQRVMQKRANGWGLFDTAGNVVEWVNDGYDAFGYGGGPVVDPFPTFPLKAGTSERVTRGGHVNVWSAICRSAQRFPRSYYARIYSVGLRLARTE